MAAMNIIEEVQFVDRHRSALIQRVTLPILIADDLLGQGMISDELYDQILAATTSHEKMRILYNGLNTGGVKSAFYKSLRKNEPHLVNDLGSGSTLDNTRNQPVEQGSGSTLDNTRNQPVEQGPKITYNPNEQLGTGAGGTIVYRGMFGNRPVAVKRIPVTFQKIAEKEVKRLLEVDYHINVVQYFWSEMDWEHQNIAIELCDKSLKEYVEKSCGAERQSEQIIDLLKQTMEGLSHLHSHNIVHRDVKPANIMLSFPDVGGKVTVKITDFGLAKKLGPESSSITSGFKGTLHWCAPELLLGVSNDNLTSAVDIFSAGLVFYYVWTGEGKNVFTLILAKGHFCFEKLQANHEDILIKDLIEQMLSLDPGKRPSADAVLKHPFFWRKDKQLKFFQDVSDRILEEKPDSMIIQTLDSDGQKVVQKNWMELMTEPVQEDLKKRKQYEGSPVKSLLRAIRNKAHHYNESPKEVQESLGSLPDGFMQYFTSRFPLLLLHTYQVMTTCAEENTFRDYYPKF